MSQTKKERAELCNDYESKYIANRKVEWLINHGKIRECVYFKGQVGDRYTIYVANKRNKNITDIHTITNMWSYDTLLGETPVASIDSNFILTINKSGKFWHASAGNTFKQLMRQGVCSIKENCDIRWVRKAYIVNFRDIHKGNILSKCTPWDGMKVDLKTGSPVNKMPKAVEKRFDEAFSVDRHHRKANYESNKANREAIQRYKDAGGDTELARGWNPDLIEIEKNMLQMDWSKVPKEDCFKHRNATLRSNIIQHYGLEEIIKDLNYEVKDEDTIDGRPYRLLDVEIPDLSVGRDGQTTHHGLYLEMLNPSTGESHFEGVANVDQWNGLNEATVKAALKWRDGDDEVKYGGSWGMKDEDKNNPYIEPVVLT